MTFYYKYCGLTQELIKFLFLLRRIHLEILKIDIVVLNEDIHCFKILSFTQTELYTSNQFCIFTI